MSERFGGGEIPWGTLAVVLTFVTSTYLSFHALKPLRPPENERSPSLQANLEVEARLWEDPFSAMRRFERDQRERCATARADTGSPPASAQAAASSASAASNGASAPASPSGLEAEFRHSCSEAAIRARRSPDDFLKQLDRNQNGDLSEALLLLVTLPGNAFVGAEEGRRRTRHAILAGMQAQGLAPDDAEHFGLLEFEFEGTGNGSGRLRVPYEMLSQQPTLRGDAEAQGPKSRFQQAAILWIDESALPRPGLPTFAHLVGRLMTPVCNTAHARLMVDALRHRELKHLPKLAVIGPSSSDILRANVIELEAAASSCPSQTKRAFDWNKDACATETPRLSCRSLVPLGPAHESCQPPVLRQIRSGYDHQCSGLDALSAEGFRHLLRAQIFNATATASDRTLQELRGQKVEQFLYDRLARIADTPPPEKLDYTRVMATDDRVLRSLVNELQIRLPVNETRRVVLVAERDSLYAKALVSELKFRLGDVRSQSYNPRLKVEAKYFFRGIDGMTINGGEDSPGRSGNVVKTVQEWPESRDQLDYLRRMATTLKASEGQPEEDGGGQIGAIGLLGVDVHDKLLALQALHDSFSDKVFFTTDLDARYTHADTLNHTRNLIVASSLPLAFADPQVQAGTPPFRDAYQSANFAAAQLAACRNPENCKAVRTALAQAIDNPSVYEIGRTTAVPVAGYEHLERMHDHHAWRAALVLPLWLTLTGTLLIWPCTPSIKRIRRWLFERSADAENQPPPEMTQCLLGVLHLSMLAYALGNAVEFAVPGRLQLWGVMLLTTIVALLSLMLLLGRASRQQPTRDTPTLPRSMAWSFLGLLALGAIGWICWPPGSDAPCQNCEPAALLEGISAWPSHFIHVLALMAVVGILDAQWGRIRSHFDDDTKWLGIQVAEQEEAKGRKVNLMRWWRHHSLMGWHIATSPSIKVHTLWLQLTTRGKSAARLSRVISAYVVTMGLMLTLFMALSDGIIPEVPVRGIDHRGLVRITLYTLLALLPALMVAVADASLLTVRFITGLGEGRGLYPEATIQQFATALGNGGDNSPWRRGFHLLPRDRDRPMSRPTSSEHGHHTLLDDWISVKLVARRTAAVGPLILGPLVVVAMLAVARSRLFDNWAITLPIALGVLAYLGWLVVLALLLKFAAEHCRKQALARMQADLRWLEGQSDEDRAIAPAFAHLVDEVRDIRQGAFAPLLEQPLFRGLLVPLGGLSGTQILEQVLLAR